MKIEFGGRLIGNGEPPLLLPDIGTFFNQDMSKAHEIISGLHAAGCDFIKGEILHTPDICLEDDTTETYVGADGQLVSENYRRLIERKVVSFAAYEEIFSCCRSLGMKLVLSVYDQAGADFAVKMNAVALKIASSNITNEFLISTVSKMGIPVILDTGKSDMEEVARAVMWARDAGCNELVVEHSPDAPPKPLANHNLNMMKSYQEAFGTLVGLSDHHAGNEMMIASVALGAHLLEKGVCLDQEAFDQDVNHAMRLSEVKALKDAIDNVYVALGHGFRSLERNRDKPAGRVGLVAKKDLMPGDQLSADNVDFVFPARGIGGEYWSLVNGWTVTRSISKRTPVQFCDVSEKLDT